MPSDEQANEQADEQAIYVVNEDPLPGEGHCTLEGEGAIVCGFHRMEAALEGLCPISCVIELAK